MSLFGKTRFARKPLALVAPTLFLPVVLLSACGGSADGAKAPAPIAEVKTAPAVLGTATNDVTIYGATEAAPGSERSIVAPAEAIIARVFAPTGTAVRAGQPIVVLRASPATRINAAKASAEAATAEAAYARAIRMRKDGLMSNADVEAARGAAVSAGAARANMGIGDGGIVMRAPRGGTVQNLTAKLGDQVAAGATVATIAGQGDLRARFGVDPALARRINPGQSIAVSVIAGGTSISVPVAGVDPQVDATTRLASVFVRLPASLVVGAGEPLRATVAVGGNASGTTIPYSALLDDGGKSFVFVVKGGVAKQRPVSAGSSSGDTVQILKGLAPGERVVVEGGTGLEDGMKVSETAGSDKAGTTR